MLSICFITIFCLFSFTDGKNRTSREAVTLQPYNYRVLGRFGQRNWRTHYPKCGLKEQSPINIDLKSIKRGDFPTNLRTTNIDTKPLEIEIRNNGYTALVTYYWACCAPKIYGGPLADVYEFKGLHFHWGTNDTYGTEHSVDGKHGVMEAHMIFKNVKFETKEKALDHPDGLCVFACRFQVTKIHFLRIFSFKYTSSVTQRPNLSEFWKGFNKSQHGVTPQSPFIPIPSP